MVVSEWNPSVPSQYVAAGQFEMFSDKLCTLDHDRARDVLEFNTFPGQRPLIASVRDDYAKKINSGKFHGSDIAFGHLAGKMYLVNGQHTCHAVLIADKEIRVRRKTSSVVTSTAWAALYAQFDVGGNRTQYHIATAFGANMGLNWTPKIVDLCASALSYETWGRMTTSKSNKDERMDLIIPEYDHCEFVNIMLTGCSNASRQMLSKKAVALAMIQTHRIDRKAARLFWTKVRDGEMLVNGTGEMTLREYLQEHTRKGSTGTSKKPANDQMFLNACILAWNAYRQNRPISLLKYYADRAFPVAA
jgi:hypothetical protein